MKKYKLFILLFLFINNIFAHEETYESVELSNLHLKIMVGYDTSNQLQIAKSYANVINEFIKKTNPTEKVFIQFNENYCEDFSENFYFLSYGTFKKNILPFGFPFSYKYDLGFLKTEKGLVLIFSENNFEISSVLKIIYFGLKNKKFIQKNQTSIKKQYGYTFLENIFSKREMKSIKTISDDLSWQILFSENKEIDKYLKPFLSKKIMLDIKNKYLINKGIKLFLQNNKIHFIKQEKEILETEYLYEIIPEPDTEALFIFCSKTSFYFINHNLKTNGKRYLLPYYFGECENVYLKITRNVKNQNYEIEKMNYTNDKNVIKLNIIFNPK